MMEKIGRTLLIAGLGVGTFYSIIYGAVSTWRNREYEMLTTKLQMQAEQERLDRQLSETRLRLLQAQIEPHFLFNTLGAVQQLAQTESPRAAELTANLITFLRASLGDMRTEQVTLQSELCIDRGLPESHENPLGQSPAIQPVLATCAGRCACSRHAGAHTGGERDQARH